MNKLASWTYAAGLSLLAAGCGRSTSYFQVHSQDRDAVLAACKSGAHRARECDNASKAAVTARHAEAEAIFRTGIASK